MQKHEKVVLKNGLEVHFLFDKSFTTSSIQMCFNVGWRNDVEEHRGLAHLFEHLVGKRTKRYSHKSEFSRKLDELGIVTNAHTGPDMTVYFQNQTNENLIKSLDMLYQAIYESVFVEEDLEKEKKVVLTEAREYLDNDDSLVWLHSMKNLFPGTTMEKFFFGDEATMKNITLKEFEEFYKIYCNPKNSRLFISTNNKDNKMRVLGFLEKFYKKNENILCNAKFKAFKDSPREIIKFSKVSKPDRVQSNMRIAYVTKDTFNKRERVAFGVVRKILLGGFSGKLIQKLRDDLGLIYWMNIGRNSFNQNLSYVMFATGCEKENREFLVEKFMEVLEEVLNSVNQSDIDKTIPISMYYTLSPASAYEDLSDLVDCVFYKTDYIQKSESVKILKTLKVKDIKKLMRKIFIKDNMSICTLE